MIPVTKARNVYNCTLYAQSRYVLMLQCSIRSSRRRTSFLLISRHYFMGQLRVTPNAGYTKFPTGRHGKNWIRAIMSVYRKRLMNCFESRAKYLIETYITRTS